jgi:hypothetical protein
MRDNRLEPYFPLSFRWLAYILLPLGVAATFPAQGFLGTLWPVIAITAGIIFIWTFHGSRIDFEKNRVMEYVGIFGFKTGNWNDLPALDKVFVTKTNYSRVVWSRVSSTQQRSSIFKAYLKGQDEFKFLFSEKKNREVIIAEAEAVASRFNLKILDCTVKPPVWLDMSK